VSAEVGVLEVAYEDTHDTQRLYDTAWRYWSLHCSSNESHPRPLHSALGSACICICISGIMMTSCKFSQDRKE
jgi:hypothetical protein